MLTRRSFGGRERGRLDIGVKLAVGDRSVCTSMIVGFGPASAAHQRVGELVDVVDALVPEAIESCGLREVEPGRGGDVLLERARPARRPAGS